MVKDEDCKGRDFQAWMPKLCDVCRITGSLLYCKADSAFLCDECDVKIHGANKVASRHERVWMCEVCEQAPAAVTCKADAAALCAACDADIHSANPLARRHERAPVASFFECARLVKPPPLPPPLPSVAAAIVPSLSFADGGGCGSLEDDDLAASWLLPKPAAAAENKGGACFAPPGGLDFFPDVDPYLDLEYASSMDAAARVSGGTDSVVPVHGHGSPSSDGFDADTPSCKGGYSYTSATSLSHSISSSSLDVGVVPDAALGDISTPYSRTAAGYGGAAVAPPYGGGAAPMDREAKVMRYKEKRKNRKFEKTIRYASRKAYAETRPRIKGRFAKRTDADVEQTYTSANLGYGLVPSF